VSASLSLFLCHLCTQGNTQSLCKDNWLWISMRVVVDQRNGIVVLIIIIIIIGG
jgi:hypothetical protein